MPTAPARDIDYNSFVLQAVASMPKGGGYSLGADAAKALRKAIVLDDGKIRIDMAEPIPSFCSGATYIVFMKTLQLIQKDQPGWTKQVLEALLAKGQSDGTGAWGRWNSNGPGTARLFFELGAGRNSQDWSQARPGDFLKIFWNQNIGHKESGHSVVFMGTRLVSGKTEIGFWSSNASTSGMGIKWVTKSSIARALLSRFERPSAIANVLKIPRTDTYLADMLKRASTAQEMSQMVGLSNLVAPVSDESFDFPMLSNAEIN